MAKSPVIYVITNTVNGKKYVGQTRCGIQERWRKHWRRAEANKGACRAIAAAIRKYGKDAFSIEAILELPHGTPQGQIDAAERDAIRNIGSLSPGGYNLEDGGKGGRPSAETLARRSAALKGRPLSEQHRRKLSESQRTREITPAVISGHKRRADKLRGVPRPREVIEKGIATRRGKPRSEAQKAAARRHSEFMSKRMKAYHEQRRRISGAKG